METGIWVQQLDDTIIYTYTSGNSDYALPEARRMRVVPRPWGRLWNPFYRSYGYATPSHLRRSQRINARMSTPREAAPYRNEILEHHNFQDDENLNKGDGSGLSEECIDECLMGSLGCERTEEEICTICQDEIQVEEKMTTLNCSHVYHLRCIKKWLKIKNECAVCRASFISIDGE